MQRCQCVVGVLVPLEQPQRERLDGQRGQRQAQHPQCQPQRRFAVGGLHKEGADGPHGHNQHHRRIQRQHGGIDTAHRAGETKAQPAPAGVGQTKPHRRVHQRRRDGGHGHDGHQPGHGRHITRHRIQHQQHHHQQGAAQHPLGGAVEVERRAVDQGVAVKIFQPPHLGPRVVQAQRHQHQQQVDDPDAKVFTARAGETDVYGVGAGCVRQCARQFVRCGGEGAVERHGLGEVGHGHNRLQGFKRSGWSVRGTPSLECNALLTLVHQAHRGQSETLGFKLYWPPAPVW